MELPTDTKAAGAPLDRNLRAIFRRSRASEFYDLVLYSHDTVPEENRRMRSADPEFYGSLTLFGGIDGMAYELAVIPDLVGPDGAAVAAWVNGYERFVTPLAMSADGLLGLYARHLDEVVQWDPQDLSRPLSFASFPWEDVDLLRQDGRFVDCLRSGRLAAWARVPENAELFDAVLGGAFVRHRQV